MYTTVKTMGEKVEKLYSLLDESANLCRELWRDNISNKWELIQETEDALKEWRPLSMDERKQEADKYAEMFNKARRLVLAVSDFVKNNY